MSEEVPSPVIQEETKPARKGCGLKFWMTIGVFGLVVAFFLFGASTMPPRKHGRIPTLQTASAIELAINSFCNEYGRLPDGRLAKVPGDVMMDTTDPDGIRLITILLGRETGSGMQNPKGLKFLDVREGAKGKGGIIYGKDGNVAGLYDSWGRGYEILLDYDADDELKAPEDSGAPGLIRGKRCAVYSLGEDGRGYREAIRNW